LEVRADDLRGITLPFEVNWEACVAIRCEHCRARAERIHYEKEFPAKERRKKKWDFMKAATDKTYQDFSKFVANRVFRRYKPIAQEVEAVQWTGRNCEEVQKLIGHNVNWTDMREVMNITDYIVRHVDGTFSILPEKDFKEKYEEVLK
jgi:methionine aminopeptidase